MASGNIAPMRLWQLQAVVLVILALTLWGAYMLPRAVAAVHTPHLSKACKTTSDELVLAICRSEGLK